MRARSRCPKNRGPKNYLVRGVQRRDYWDNRPKASVRQKLKRELRRELEG
jgi:hypothetical protein